MCSVRVDSRRRPLCTRRYRTVFRESDCCVGVCTPSMAKIYQKGVQEYPCVKFNCLFLCQDSAPGFLLLPGKEILNGRCHIPVIHIYRYVGSVYLYIPYLHAALLPLSVSVNGLLYFYLSFLRVSFTIGDRDFAFSDIGSVGSGTFI